MPEKVSAVKHMNKKCSHRVNVIFAMQRTLRNETFSCMTAMQSSFIKRKLLDRKQRINDDRRVSGSDTDNNYDGYEDEGIIPG